ncbi:MAG TPA: DUF3570 domain-containing protein [Puia sp.]|nr:DUF3570 domain-containing protein [Puia sp.]
MRRVCLTITGLVIGILAAFSQNAPSDSSGFKSRPLKVDEVNILSSYYSQTADKSAVSGGDPGPRGIGNVTDLSNGVEIRMVGWDPKGRKNSLTGGIGMDNHTAASQAYVDSSGRGKSTGTRIYPTLDWTIENQHGTSFGIGAYYSAEHNYYHSVGLNTSFSAKTKHNGEFSAKLTGYFDRIVMITPSELIPVDTANITTGPATDSVIYITTASGRTEALSYGTGQVLSKGGKVHIPSSSRDSYSASFVYSQVINQRMQGALLVDLALQTGYLGLPFHRVYFADSTKAVVEKLPSQRVKLPVGLRMNYFLGDRVILRAYYRFYIDNWGIRSHTASLEIPVKITPFFSISPFYRYYNQSASKYFAAYKAHTPADAYYTSNYALSAFSGQYFGAGLRLAPPGGIGDKHFSVMELRYGHYAETTNLVSNVIALNLTFR